MLPHISHRSKIKVRSYRRQGHFGLSRIVAEGLDVYTDSLTRLNGIEVIFWMFEARFGGVHVDQIIDGLDFFDAICKAFVRRLAPHGLLLDLPRRDPDIASTGDSRFQTIDLHASANR